MTILEMNFYYKVRKTAVFYSFIHSNIQQVPAKVCAKPCTRTWGTDVEQNRNGLCLHSSRCQKGPSEVTRMFQHKAVPAPRSHESHSTDGKRLFLQTSKTGLIQLHLQLFIQQVPTVCRARYLVPWETPRNWPSVYKHFLYSCYRHHRMLQKHSAEHQLRSTHPQGHSICTPTVQQYQDEIKYIAIPEGKRATQGNSSLFTKHYQLPLMTPCILPQPP